MHTGSEDDREHDVCLSFAGEQRPYVEKVADELASHGIRVFYDSYEQATLWGKDLYEHLDWIYRKSAKYCLMFTSEDYARKVWTSHERKSAQARAINEQSEYVLPVKFDDTEIPGIRPTIAYIDARECNPEDLAALVIKKLGPRQVHNFFPPKPDLLFKHLEAKDKRRKDMVEAISRGFTQALQRMNSEERQLIGHILTHGCTYELPKNVHANLDLIRRDLDISPTRVMQIMDGLCSLGFKSKLKEEYHQHSEDLVVVTWNDRTSYKDIATFHYASRFSTSVAYSVIKVGIGRYCTLHGAEHLERLDFSALSSATATEKEGC